MAKSVLTDKPAQRGIRYEEISDLAELVSRLGLEELEFQVADERLRIVGKRAAATAVVSHAAPVHADDHSLGATAPAPPAAAPASPPAPVDNPKWKKITAPMVGTLYRSSAPGTAPFVQVGDRVQDNTVMCIIEAMKLMNEIKAEMSGTVREVLVENGVPVEYGQPIFVIDPA
jgi:acetyl-CoA carboxylase biotin carboxyl carrier protein